MRSLLVLALFCASACDFFDDDSPEPGTSIPVDDIASSYKEAYCTFQVRCGQFPDQATCVSANFSGGLSLDANVVAAIHAGKISYDGRKVKKCFDALAAATCDSTDQDSRTPPAACSTFLRGIGKDGDPCVMDEECASQSCSISSPTDTCTIGQCFGDAPPPLAPPAQIGESCGANGCVANAYCDSEQLTPVCVALKSQGMACTSAVECAVGLSCAGTTTRTCMQLPGLDQACSSGLPCRDYGQYCDMSTAQPTCKKVGLPPATCSQFTQCADAYPCDLATGKCTKAPSIGQSCTSTFTCFDVGTYCDSTSFVCAAVKGDGSTCRSDDECASGTCDTSLPSPVCITPPTCY